MIATPNCLLFEPSNLFELLRITNNLSFNILKRIKLYLFDFTNSETTRDWSIDGNGPSIALTLLDRKYWPPHVDPLTKPHTIRKQLDSLRSTPHIRYVGQCCDSSSLFLRTWQCLRPLIGTNIRGGSPSWYKALKQIITTSVSNYCIIPNYQPHQPNMLAITVPMSTVSTKRSKREWIIFKHGSTVHYGHITGKSSNSKLLTVQH